MADYFIEVVKIGKVWHWRLVSQKNHEIVAFSENYSSCAKCMKTANAVKLGSIDDVIQIAK